MLFETDELPLSPGKPVFDIDAYGALELLVLLAIWCGPPILVGHTPLWRQPSNPPKQHQNEKDDQDDADDADAAVSIAVTVSAEAPTEAAKKKDHEDDNENKS